MPGRQTSFRRDSPATAGTLFSLIRENAGSTRQQLARATGLAPSTVSLRVDALIAAGLIEESGHIKSTGGRQPRLLRVRADSGCVVAVSLGTHHASVLVCDLDGTPHARAELSVDARQGPRAVLTDVWNAIQALLDGNHVSAESVRGVALGIAAPINPRTGAVSSSAQLPGWDHIDLFALFREVTGHRVIIENDANLLAISEQRLAEDAGDNLLAIKVGSRIGSGIISNGVLHRGESGAGGEFSHAPTRGVATIECNCGLANCLESVAGGSAIIARLRTEGYDLVSTSDLLAFARNGDVRVTEVLREAGTLVGETLAEVVNFINPRLVVFGGSLSVVQVFVAAVRGVLFQRCMPAVTEVLDVRLGAGGPDAEVMGASHLLLDMLLSVDEIDHLLSKGSPRVI